MRQMKRLTALILAAMLTFSNAGYAAAAELTEQSDQTEYASKAVSTEQSGTKTQVSPTDGIRADLESTENMNPVSTEALSETENTETGEPQKLSNTEKEETVENALINYAMVESPVVATPGTEKVVLGIGDGETAVKNAVLTYTNTTTGAVSSVNASEILENQTVTFEMSFQDSSSAGKYQLTSLAYETENGSYAADFAAIGIEAAFGVDAEVTTAPDDVFVEEDAISQEEAASLDIVSIDQNGNASSEDDIVDAIGNAQAQIPAANDVDATGAGNVIVVLDPGHGGSDGGAQGNGLSEKNLTLKIASYCKSELEQYSKVTVYMTRSTDTYLTLDQRVAYAKQVGASIFVSIHINSGSTTASGSEVYYPNSNYNATAGSTGNGVASKILANLVALGLVNRGVKIRNSENGTTYPDGSLADYYGVIRQSKEAGFPGIIVEHAFIGNTSDAVNYLSTDAQLQKLGIADATGIAQYYGLTKGTAALEFTSIQATDSNSIKLKWNKQDGVSGYDIARSTSKNGNYTVVKEITKASTTSWTDTTVEAGKTYYYKIRTYKVSGNATTYGIYTDPESVYTLKAPAVTAIKSKSSGSIQITWEKNDVADSYDLYRSTSSTDGFGKIATITGGTNVTYTDTSLTNNQTYYYKVIAQSVEGGTTYSSSFGTVKGGVCIAKPSITAIVSKDSASLKITWKQVAGASGYVLYRSTASNGTYSKAGTVSSGETVTYTDEKLTAGQTYYYKVEAFNYNDTTKGVSGKSGAKSEQVLKKTSFTTLASAANTIQIKWKKNTSGTGYQIYRSTSKNGTYKKIKTISKNSTTSYTDKELTGGQTYYYKIMVIKKDSDGTGYSSYSAVKSAYVIEKTSIKSITSKTDTSLKITWNKVDEATNYIVYRSTSKNGTYTKVKTTDADTLSCTDKKLSTNKTYYYKVEVQGSGVGKSGTSGLCAAKSGKTVDEVSISTIKVASSAKLKLTWKKGTGAVGYEIARSESKDGTYAVIGTISKGSTTSYTDKVPKQNKTYYYKIRVISKIGSTKQYGRYSGEKGMKTYSKPVITSATSSKGTSLTVKWNKVASASGYTVSRSTSKTGSYKVVKTIKSGSTVSFKDKDVKVNKTYYYKVQAIGKNGVSSVSEMANAAVLAQASLSAVNYVVDSGMNLSWAKVKNATGYTVSRSTSKNGTYTSVYSGSALTCTDGTVADAKTYYYKVNAYSKTSFGTSKGAESAIVSQTSGYKIMGDTSMTKAQMVTLYEKSGRTYPAAMYKDKGAATLEDFVDIVIRESKAEGVKAEVIWAQVCLETGFLSFVGDVSAEQCNFGGIGATGNGVPGLSFADVTTGIRAQVQHMKAYASTEGLNQTCVDPRFTYVQRGCAKYVENLGSGKWAADPLYAGKLLGYIKTMKSYK